LFSLGDDEFEARNVAFLGLDHVVTGGDLLLDLLNVSIESGVLILVLLLLRFLSGNSGILGLDLLLELRDLLSHSLELHLELCDLLGGLEKVLRVKVPVRTHGLIEVLLLLQATLSLYVLLLKLRDQVVFELNLFKALIVLGISLRCLNTIFLLVFLELIDQLLELLRLSLVPLDLVLELLKLALKGLDGITLFSLFLLCQYDILVKKVTFTHFGFYALFGFINICTIILVLLVGQS
jgi:hypothetical protein